MQSGDLILTPLYLILIYFIAYFVRNSVTNHNTVKYYIPALTVKIVGAIGLGLIYQFYYGGGKLSGDTANYYYQSKIIYEAFDHSFSTGLKLLLANGEYNSETSIYANRILWYNAPSEYFIIKLASFFGLLCFHTYMVISLFFVLVSFSGMWAMYRTFLKLFPQLHKEFAIAIFFLPSVFFWGSGLLKDSVTIGALGWLFYGFYAFFIQKNNLILSAIIIFAAAYVIYTVKVYILLSFLPPAALWIFSENNSKIKNSFIRNLVKPIFIGLGVLLAYYSAAKLTEGDRRYDIDNIGERSKINTLYLTVQVKNGSAYNIGIFDGSISSLLSVGPQAIVVALYRPFIWEVRNPVMFLSAIEATLFIFLTLRIFFTTGFFKTLKLISSKPILTFCFLFSLMFAFGVGTNSGNFGTLVRYKIPLMPFYLSALYIMQDMSIKKIVKRKLIKQV